MNSAQSEISIRRFTRNAIITPALSAAIGTNIQGPSLIRVPEWLPDPLGKYYLYFADHKGLYIRLAYADDLSGPWTVHEPGTLQLEQSHFRTEPAKVPEQFKSKANLGGFATGPMRGVPAPLNSATKPDIASPEVIVREDLKQIVMYYHGLEDFAFQRTRVAQSSDGIHFEASEPIVTSSYLRVFNHDNRWYGLAMPGIFYRSRDGFTDFEQSEVRLFPNTMRHNALLKRDNTLYIFWTRVGDTPEHVLLSKIDIGGDWSSWATGEPADILYPEQHWEGANQPLVPSVRDAINIPVNQLRDPAIFVEGDRTYLLYAFAGEAGIAIVELLMK